VRRADLTVGMRVYYVDHAYEWKEGVERVDDCWAVVVDTDSWYRQKTTGCIVRGGVGSLVHIETAHGWDRYVTLAAIRGPYGDIAQARRRLQAEMATRKEAEGHRRRARREAGEAVISEARELGLTTVSFGFRDRDMQYMEMTTAELAALLAEVRAGRETQGR